MPTYCDINNVCELKEHSFIETLVTFIGILNVSLFLSCFITAHSQYYINKYFGLYDEEVVDEIVEYCEKYCIDEIKDNEDETYKVNPNSYIMEYSPLGIIMMKYDYNYEGFVYWCNKTQVPYKVLETVARKYVKTFTCKNIYIDRNAEIEKKKKALEEKQKQLEENEKMKSEDTHDENNIPRNESENSVFANFKSYNKPGGKQNSKQNGKDDVIVCDKANKFKRIGNINEFELSQESEYKKVDNKPKLDFETFKRLFANNEVQDTDNEETDSLPASSDGSEFEQIATEDKKDV